MVPLVVGDIKLSVRRALISIAHGYQIIWVLISGLVLHVVDRRAYGCSFSFRLTGRDATSDSAVPLGGLFPFQTNAEIVRDALKGMEIAFKGKAGELTSNGIMVFNKFVKPKLRPLLAEAFRDVEYLISAECGGERILPLGPGLWGRAKGNKP